MDEVTRRNLAADIEQTRADIRADEMRLSTWPSDLRFLRETARDVLAQAALGPSSLRDSTLASFAQANDLDPNEVLTVVLFDALTVTRSEPRPSAEELRQADPGWKWKLLAKCVQLERGLREFADLPAEGPPLSQ